MAQANVGSRRTCEAIIEQGRVKVNGKVIALGEKADPDTDTIVVDGQKLSFKRIEKKYYVVNKPPNMLSSMEPVKDDNRPIVRELIPGDDHLFAVGRLDVQSEGLMILTNDGEMAHKLTHPRYEHTKTYKVVVHGAMSEETVEQWQDGVFIQEGKTAPCYAKVLERDHETTTLRIVLIEGKKRQIRHVAAKLGHPVKKLMRTHIGQLGLGTLRRGEWYLLNAEEVEALQTPAWELDAIRARRRQLKQKKRYPRSN